MMQTLMQTLASGLLLGGIYAINGVGFTLIFGTMNIVHVAYSEYLMLSMYFTYFLWSIWGIDPYVSLLICLPVLFIMGVITQKFLINPVLKEAHVTQMLLTIGLLIFLQNLALFLWTSTYRAVIVPYGTSTFNVGGVLIGIPRMASFVLALAMTVALYVFIKKTYTGKALQATAQDSEAAMLMGININHMYLLAFGIGSALAGAAGVLLSPIYPVYPRVGTLFLGVTFLIVVMGGLGNFWGAFSSGLIIGVVEALSAVYIGGKYKEIVYFVLFVFILLFRPEGLLTKRR